MKYRFGLLSLSLAVGLSYLSICAASAAELQLAGIRLGRPALTVMQKYGNPSSVIIGGIGQQTGTAGTPAAPAAPGLTGMGGPAGNPFDIAGLGNAMGGLFGTPTPSPQATPAADNGTTSKPVKVAPEVTWIYNYPKNKQFQFKINPDGIVIQITALGVDWPNIRTSRGITLGQTYKDVIQKYGYPESHLPYPNVTLGSVSLPRMDMDYSEKQRVIFTCVGKNITGITIGLMD